MLKRHALVICTDGWVDGGGLSLEETHKLATGVVIKGVISHGSAY